MTSTKPSLSPPPVEDYEVNFFPDLPPYSDPTTGLISRLPRTWIPYAQLMRLDRPAGFYAFYIPYLIGLTFAACIAPVVPRPLAVVKLAAVLVPFNILLRGAACTWNDNVDQKFDRRVRRCRHRPIARGAVSTSQGHAFTLAQLALGLCLVVRCVRGSLLPARCVPHAGAAVALFLVYALMKRVTYYPQVILGVAFAWAVPFGVSAFDIDPLSEGARAPTAALSVANVLWTVTYDTIYAHQDIEDDEKAGVKGMALRFRDSTKLLAGVLSAIMVGLLILCGTSAGFDAVYFIGTAGGVTAAMTYYIWDVDLKKPESCGLWFHRQFFLVGAGFMAGLVGQYINRLHM